MVLAPAALSRGRRRLRSITGSPGSPGQPRARTSYCETATQVAGSEECHRTCLRAQGQLHPCKPVCGGRGVTKVVCPLLGSARRGWFRSSVLQRPRVADGGTGVNEPPPGRGAALRSRGTRRCPVPLPAAPRLHGLWHRYRSGIPNLGLPARSEATASGRSPARQVSGTGGCGSLPVPVCG